MRAPKLATVSSLKFPCCRLVTNEQYQRDATSSRVMNHVIAANQPLHWLRLLYDITSEKSRILFVQPAMLKNRTILISFDQRIEVLCRLGQAHHVERLLPSQCGKTQMARRPSMLSKQTGKAVVAYVKYKYSRTVGLHYISCYVALILGLLTIPWPIQRGGPGPPLRECQKSKTAPYNLAGFCRPRKNSATTPPPSPLNRVGFRSQRENSSTTPPPH